MNKRLQSERLSPRSPAADRPLTVTAATVLLAVKGLLGLWAGLVLLTASPSHHRSFLGAVIRQRHRSIGLVLLLMVAAIAVVLVGLVLMRAWARIATFGLEAVGVVLALSRIASRPGAAVLSLALSTVVVALLLTPTASKAFARQLTQ